MITFIYEMYSEYITTFSYVFWNNKLDDLFNIKMLITTHQGHITSKMYFII